MKKILLFFCGLFMLTACSSEEPIVEASADLMAQESEVITALKAYNATIEPGQDSRLFGRFGHWCAVGTADVLGAYRLAQVGGFIGAMGGPIGAGIGASVGAIVGGVGASYGANALLSSACPPPDDILKRTVLVYLTYKDMPIIGDPDLDIRYPSKSKARALSAGVLHNAMMKSLEESSDVRASDVELNEYERSVLTSSDFQKMFVQMVSSADSPERLAENTDADKIMNLFIEAVKKAESDKIVVCGIVNDYIQIVEDKSVLDEEERSQVYSALSVGAYSCKYWTEVSPSVLAQ